MTSIMGVRTAKQAFEVLTIEVGTCKATVLCAILCDTINTRANARVISLAGKALAGQVDPCQKQHIPGKKIVTDTPRSWFHTFKRTYLI